MLKLLRLSAVLSTAAVILSLPQTVFSRPLSEASGYPVARNSRTDSLFCYMRTSQGATLNLENLCTADDGSGSGNPAGNVSSNSAATTPPNPSAPNTTPPVDTFVTSPGAPGGVGTANGVNTDPNNVSTNGTTTNSNGSFGDANNSINDNRSGIDNSINNNPSNINNNLNNQQGTSR
ncbi:MAG: hypothetical protein LDL41_16155 [Coleofasciculus sp. S288]|nr:hypothetical protein [Coleofasciculus sp. S288]